MLKCEICNIEPQTSLLTRCCKLFICQSCRDKYQKIGTCICSKAINKKQCQANPQLFEIVRNYYQGRPQECDRCDKIAQIDCFDCNMLYCPDCNAEVHHGKGFARHNRDLLQKQGKCSHKKLIERARRREQFCEQHRQPIQVVCQCSQPLCSSTCQKSHRQVCNKLPQKPKTLKQHKQQYFTQILHKIKKISEYKQKLQTQRKQYIQHYMKQKQTYQIYAKLLDQQLQGIKKILDIKIIEIRNRIAQYWRECTDVHQKNLYVLEFHQNKFDDFGRLSQKFVERVVGLDYLEKRVKRIYINKEFFNFKLQGIEEVQFSVLNLTSTSKTWQPTQAQNMLLNLQTPGQQKNPRQKRTQPLLPPSTANSQLLLQCSQNPLITRPLALKSSHNQICFQFLHLPYQNDCYEIEYGVGLKMKGQEIFKKIANKNGNGVISALNPSTKYRIRMRVVGGEWGPITEVRTMELPRMVADGIMVSKHSQDIPFQTLKMGTIYGSNQINFGIHSWEIKIFPPKNTDEQTACISIGVSNKETKKPIFVGTTLNYGYQKAMLAVKVTLNCDENRMTISNSTGGQDQVYQNLPNFPIYPAIQNKGSYPVQIQCIFT